MNDGGIRKLAERVFGRRASGHGPASEAMDGWVDAKPYTSVFSNGVFEGYDGNLWMYFRLPQDVRVEWLKDPAEAVTNQHFFVDLCNRLGQQLNMQTERTRRDLRRKFHIQITQDEFPGIKPPENCTPAQADYLSRMSGQYGKPVWNGFLGVQLMPSSIFYEAYGFKARVDRYLEVMRQPDLIQMSLYEQEMAQMVTLMSGLGFRSLDFIADREDLERLTCWYGVSDDQYGLPRQLAHTRMQEPLHGLSIITPRWGELGMYAVRPQDDLFMVDPASRAARWTEPIYRPNTNVVCVSIRGEVRAPRVAENLLDLKHTKREASLRGEQLSAGGHDHLMQEASRLSVSRRVADAGHALLDNVEIVVACTIRAGERNTLSSALAPYRLEAAPLTARQPTAILSTLPTYPKPIFPVRRNNTTRSILSNQMFPGALAMSGIFRSTRPCGESGIILGLSDGGPDGGYTYQEIFTSVEAAYERSRVPGMLITGRPGAGKTQSMLQMASQAVYQGYSVFYLNPKKDATLKPVFDHLGGTTVNMSTQYLYNNPGLMDPVFFLRDRESVGTVLADAILMALKTYDDRGSGASLRRTTLKAEVMDRAVDTRNRCSYDILFGNPDLGTEGITDKEVLKFIAERVRISPFWRAFLSRGDQGERGSDLQQRLTSGRSVLIEWDGTMELPNARTATVDYRDEHIDSILSITLAFKYAVEVVGDGRSGGMITVDEAWVLKASPEAMQVLDKGAREWRQGNIMLVMGTQRILDFLTPGQANMATFFDRYLMMAISENDEEEMAKFFEITGLPDTARNRQYIIRAGIEKDKVDGNTIPRGYYVDRIYDWSGGLVCGPWPELELNLGRTDKAGEAARAQAATTSREENAELDPTSMYGGALDALISQLDVEQPEEAIPGHL